jgi:hypothetical protein
MNGAEASPSRGGHLPLAARTTPARCGASPELGVQPSAASAGLRLRLDLLAGFPDSASSCARKSPARCRSLAPLTSSSRVRPDATPRCCFARFGDALAATRSRPARRRWAGTNHPSMARAASASVRVRRGGLWSCRGAWYGSETMFAWPSWISAVTARRCCCTVWRVMPESGQRQPAGHPKDVESSRWTREGTAIASDAQRTCRGRLISRTPRSPDRSSRAVGTRAGAGSCSTSRRTCSTRRCC